MCGEKMNDSFGKRALRKVLKHHSSLVGPVMTIPVDSQCCTHGVERRKRPEILTSDLFFMMEPVQEHRFADDFSAFYGEGLCTSQLFRDSYFYILHCNLAGLFYCQ